MSRTLKTDVYVTAQGGHDGHFAAGTDESDVPDWARGSMGPHCWEGDEAKAEEPAPEVETEVVKEKLVIKETVVEPAPADEAPVEPESEKSDEDKPKKNTGRKAKQ